MRHNLADLSVLLALNPQCNLYENDSQGSNSHQEPIALKCLGKKKCYSQTSFALTALTEFSVLTSNLGSCFSSLLLFASTLAQGPLRCLKVALCPSRVTSLPA